MTPSSGPRETPGVLDRLRSRWRRSRRRLLARRRSIAAVLAVVAVALAVQAVRPPPPPTTTVAIAHHDLAAGTVLAASDLSTARLPRGAVPDGAVRAAASRLLVGRVLAGAARRGEAITDVRLVSATLTRGRPDLVAVPVRLPDAGMAALLRVGDRIRLLATDPQGGDTTTVASDVLVLALPAASAGDERRTPDAVTSGVGGRLVVVGIPAEAVAPVTSAAVRYFLTYAFAH